MKRLEAEKTKTAAERKSTATVTGAGRPMNLNHDQLTL